MKIGRGEAKRLECSDCPKWAKSKALEEVIRTAGSREERAAKRKAIEERFRVVATCDNPTYNQLWVYRACQKPLCAEHAQNQPQEGFHVCAGCAEERAKRA